MFFLKRYFIMPYEEALNIIKENRSLGAFIWIMMT
jgi:hypothetical protein